MEDKTRKQQLQEISFHLAKASREARSAYSTAINHIRQEMPDRIVIEEVFLTPEQKREWGFLFPMVQPPGEVVPFVKPADDDDSSDV